MGSTCNGWGERTARWERMEMHQLSGMLEFRFVGDRTAMFMLYFTCVTDQKCNYPARKRIPSLSAQWERRWSLCWYLLNGLITTLHNQGQTNLKKILVFLTSFNLFMTSTCQKYLKCCLFTRLLTKSAALWWVCHIPPCISFSLFFVTRKRGSAKNLL